MEMLTGRVTADAKINTLKDDRQVVNFSIAINDYYKPKNSTEGKKATLYVNCGYWITTKVAERLTKGAIVQVGGRLEVRTYKIGDEPKASLNCHVNYINILHSTRKAAPAAQQAEAEPATDDLPF